LLIRFLESLVHNQCDKALSADDTIIDINAFPTEIKSKYQNNLKLNPNYQVSNIGDELLLLTKASDNPFKTNINSTLEEFAKCINSSKNAYATLTDARNSVLHGKLGSKGAMMTKYLIFLILLSKISA
jgi:hypothetical protein